MRRLVAAALVLAAGPASAGPRLARALEKATSGPDYAHAFWGIAIADLKTGEAVYELNADKLFAPASATKLFSGAAALERLGPEFRFETRLHRRGEVQDGVLKGDLVLKASGDPNLSGRSDAAGRLSFKDVDHIYAGFSADAELTETDPLAGLDDLATQITAAGIRRVEGEVLVDDRLFEGGEGSGSGPSRLTPIMVNDNVVDVLVTPASEVGRPASIAVRPATAYVQVEARVLTVPAGGGTDVSVQPAGPYGFVVRGTIEAGRKPLLRSAPVPDPVAFARALLIESLGRRDVAVAASILSPPGHEALPAWDGYDRLPVVASRVSAPFAEALRIVEKVSHNLHASTLPLLVAVTSGKRTLKDGLQEQGRILAGLGVDVKSISFGGGAGGAPGDQVTPRATVQLLRAMASRPAFAAYEASLPVLGVDGTLAKSVGLDSPARGRVKAKTGTLVWDDGMNGRFFLASKALAGYLETRSGRRLAVAFFVNKTFVDSPDQTAREGKMLGRLCEIVVVEE
jgi:serine-type D-Ala-D-Ala carboxypeptidase/endopeptidase (penicillin-binding protein 4)